MESTIKEKHPSDLESDVGMPSSGEPTSLYSHDGSVKDGDLLDQSDDFMASNAEKNAIKGGATDSEQILAELRKQIRWKDNMIEEEKKEKDKLVTLLSTCVENQRRAEIPVNELTEKLAEKNDQIAHLEMKIQNQSGDIQNAKREIQTLETSKNRLQSDIDRKSKALTKLKKENDELVNEIEKKNKSYTKLENDMINLKNKHDDMAKNVKSLKSSLVAEEAKNKKMFGELQNQINRLSLKVEKHENESDEKLTNELRRTPAKDTDTETPTTEDQKAKPIKQSAVSGRTSRSYQPRRATNQ